MQQHTRNSGRRARLAFVALAACVATALVPAAAAAATADWRITNTGPAGQQVTLGSATHRLINQRTEDALVYGSRTYGINLVWGSATGTPNIRFVRQLGSGL